MAASFPGISFQEGRRPGFQCQGDNFAIRFEGVHVISEEESVRRSIKLKLETCYDWKLVMDKILEISRDFVSVEDFEEDTQVELSSWLGALGGWGLTFAILPIEFQQFFLLIFARVSQEAEGPLSHEEMYERMITFYETESHGLPFSDLVPKLAVRLSGKGATNEREKWFSLCLTNGGKFKAIIALRIKKKRFVRTLVERCAEVVGQIEDDPEVLEIPVTLKPLVLEYILDAGWVQEYWFAQWKASEETNESIEEEDSENLEDGEQNRSQDDTEVSTVDVSIKDAKPKGIFSRILTFLWKFWRRLFT